MLLHKKLTALLAACMFANSFASSAFALTSSNPVLTTDVTAKVTSHHGVVFKRDFVDFVKQTYGDPIPVADQDKLREGMQIGTGNDSWAEVQWANVRTRAWSNTLFAVAPNKRLVYLAGGEMLFRLDKHRPDKNQPYYIWTKVLQARIRGTTVLVQAKANTTRFTVMEGFVDIWNRLDHSHVTLSPGVVYEVKGFDMSKQVPLPDLKSSKSTAEPADKTSSDTGNGVAPYKPSPLFVPNTEDKTVQDVTYDSKTFMPLFQSKYEQTNVYASNSHALQNHALVTGLNGPIDSIDLISAAQRELPGFNSIVPIKTADSARLERIVYKNLQVKGVPTNADWYVGKSFVGKISQLSFVDLQPKGVIFNPTTQLQTAVAPRTPSIAPMSAVLPYGGIIPLNGIMTEKRVNLDEDVPAPVQEFAQPNLGTSSSAVENVPSVVPGMCTTPPNVNNTFSSTSGMVVPIGSPTMVNGSSFTSSGGAASAAVMHGAAGAAFAPAVSGPGVSLNVNGAVTNIAPASAASFSNSINNTLNNLSGSKLK